MAMAAPGMEIRMPDRGPPWLPIAFEICAITVARWPGRLWQVELIEPAEVENQPKTGANWVRAIALRIEKELPVSMLFGPQGAAVCAIADVAGAITLDQAALLSSGRHPEADQAYDRVFRTWLAELGIAIKPGRNFAHALDSPPAKDRSPIHSGLTLVHGEIFRRATSLVGDDAIVIDNDGEDCWLVEPWIGASSALCAAALALGAPDIVSAADHAILTYAWATVIGAPPDSTKH